MGPHPTNKGLDDSDFEDFEESASNRVNSRKINKKRQVKAVEGKNFEELKRRVVEKLRSGMPLDLNCPPLEAIVQTDYVRELEESTSTGSGEQGSAAAKEASIKKASQERARKSIIPYFNGFLESGDDLQSFSKICYKAINLVTAAYSLYIDLQILIPNSCIMVKKVRAAFGDANSVADSRVVKILEEADKGTKNLKEKAIKVEDHIINGDPDKKIESCRLALQLLELFLKLENILFREGLPDLNSSIKNELTRLQEDVNKYDNHFKQLKSGINALKDSCGFVMMKDFEIQRNEIVHEMLTKWNRVCLLDIMDSTV